MSLLRCLPLRPPRPPMSKSFLGLRKEGLRHLNSRRIYCDGFFMVQAADGSGTPGSHATWARIPAAKGKESAIGGGRLYLSSLALDLPSLHQHPGSSAGD